MFQKIKTRKNKLNYTEMIKDVYEKMEDTMITTFRETSGLHGHTFVPGSAPSQSLCLFSLNISR